MGTLLQIKLCLVIIFVCLFWAKTFAMKSTWLLEKKFSSTLIIVYDRMPFLFYFKNKFNDLMSGVADKETIKKYLSFFSCTALNKAKFEKEWVFRKYPDVSGATLFLSYNCLCLLFSAISSYSSFYDFGHSEYLLICKKNGVWFLYCFPFFCFFFDIFILIARLNRSNLVQYFLVIC